MVAFTVASSLVIGYVAHYFMNVRPLKRRQMQDKTEKENDEENEEKGDGLKEVEKTIPPVSEQKQIGVVKGVINSELVHSLRKTASHSTTFKQPDLPKGRASFTAGKHMKEINTGPEDDDDDDDDDELVVVQESGKKRSMSLQEDCSLSEKELFSTLGNLHGKLATAQLRARTRRMQADMSTTELNDEAQMKAKQLESIMSLMMQNQEKFGITCEDDIKEQLDMYNF